MNNKLLKRIASIVLAVSVLSVCAFAAPITEKAYDKTTAGLSFTLDNTGVSELTYIAYAVTDGAQGDVIAIDQVPANQNTISVTVDATKLVDADAIYIFSGDNLGTEKSGTAVALKDVIEFLATLKNTTEKDVVLDGVTYKNVPHFSLSLTKPTIASTLTVTGLKAVYGEENETEHDLSINGSTTLNIVPVEGSGNLVIDNIYLLGADEAFLNDADATIEPVWSLQ